jgi:hypothetical protein
MVKTRKTKKGILTIPQLRKAFDHMESFTGSLVKRTRDPVQRRKAFQKEWAKVFYRNVNDASADAYLQFEAKKHGTRGKQRGGAALEGAPLDYSTRPGIAGVYGVFPAYVSSGFDFYNDINMEGPTAGCGVENTTPKVPISIGSNEVQKGGKTRSRKTRKAHRGGGIFTDLIGSLTYRPIAASVPTSVAYDAQMMMKGQTSGVNPSPNTATPPYQPIKPVIVSGTATSIDRDLMNEVRS